MDTSLDDSEPKIIGGALARAIIIISLILLVTGLSLPFIQSTQFWIFQNEYSLLQTVEQLYRQGELALAGLVLLFSILTPTIKALSLVWINFTKPGLHSGTVMSFADIIGRYALVEVLVVAVLITIWSTQAGLNIQTREGLWLFTASAFGFLMAAHLIRRDLKSK